MAEEIKKEDNVTPETTEETVVLTGESVKEEKDEQTMKLEESVRESEESISESEENVQESKESVQGSVETARKSETEQTDKESIKETMQKEENIDGYVERKRLLFFGLPWTFTKYTVKEDLLTIQNGLLRTEENDCYMYKIQDVKLVTTLIERLFRLGTVICYTGDVTNPEIHLEHIKHAREVKNYILKASEEARIKRRTLNTMDIGAIVEDDFCECDHTNID